MEWAWSDLWEEIGGGAERVFSAFQADGDAKRKLQAMLSPVDPYNRSSVLTPLVAAAGVVGVVMLSGVALAAAAIAAAALLALYFLLSQVFGFEIDFDPAQASR